MKPIHKYSYIHKIWLLLIAACLLATTSTNARTWVNEDSPPSFSDFTLTGEVVDGRMQFSLSGNAHVHGRKGGQLRVVSGAVAVTGIEKKSRYKVALVGDAYVLKFPSRGTYPVVFNFKAQVSEVDGWKSVRFNVVTGSLRKVQVKGLPADVKLDIQDASAPIHKDLTYNSFLATGEDFHMRWKIATPEKASKLFYSAEAVCEASAAAGLLRQTHLLRLSVMQGEMKTLRFGLAGKGEVVRVEGKDILSWKILPAPAGGERGLEVHLNQVQQESYTLVVRTQTPLGVFPLEFEPMRLVPADAVRYGGYLRIVNEGAVRLEVISALGLSQLSPDLFPRDKLLLDSQKKEAVPVEEGKQSFVYRFSGADYTLNVQADNILPELTVSQILTVHLGDNDTILQTELELDIREAPLREFNILIPADFSVSQLDANSLGDYFVTPEPGQANLARLRLVFSTPLSGRQILGIKLEKNLSLKDQDWPLPRVEPQGVKSVRGYVGVTAAEGLRLSSPSIEGVTEVATAFFPKRLPGLQLAFRIKEEDWSIVLNAARLDLTIQADSLHLFSIGEGIAYGSTIINFFIVGAPVSEFKFEAPESYGNIEFIGQEVRNWKREGNQYQVFLHTPQGGAYTLLATYDSRFNPHGETLEFTGLKPIDTQSEQGTIIVTSDHYYRQPEAELEKISAMLIEMEHEEIPAEYRLLYDAPIVSSYQFTARPFEASLNLKPYSQSMTVGQVVDYAQLNTRVSGKGEVLTDVHYLLKSKGATNLQLHLPENSSLWTAKVDGKKVTPISSATATLIPLPQNADPNTIVSIDLKLATAGIAKAGAGKNGNQPIDLHVAAPSLEAPVLLTDWQFKAEEGFRLDFLSGGITPINARPNNDGFTWLHKLVNGGLGRRPLGYLGGALLAAFAATLLVQFARRTGKTWKDGSVIGLGFAGITLCGLAFILVFRLLDFASMPSGETWSNLEFRAPVQLSGAELDVTIRNVELGTGFPNTLRAWPAAVGVVLWFVGLLLILKGGVKRFLGNFVTGAAWTFILWGGLSLPNDGQALPYILASFLGVHVAVPIMRHLFRIPRGEFSTSPHGVVAGTAVFMLALFFLPNESDARITFFKKRVTAAKPVAAQASHEALAKGSKPVLNPKVANKQIKGPSAGPSIHFITEVEALHYRVQIDEGRANFTFLATWDAKGGDKLLLAREPAIITGGTWDKKSFKLQQVRLEGKGVYYLEAIRAKREEISITFQEKIASSKDTWQSIQLPGITGLLNTVELDIDSPDLVVESPQSVSLVAKENPLNTRTTATATLMNAMAATLRWRPRSRDIKAEDSVYYAELNHLFTPTAGIVEGLHEIRIRPAQGQVRALAIEVPGSLTITDVVADQMQGWRFDPDTRLLDLYFEPGFSQPFAFHVRSQVAAKPLPYDQEVSPITLKDAAGQVGLVGVATGPEVQLGDVHAELLSPINLEDFPSVLVKQAMVNSKPLTLRRSFRYSDLEARMRLSALPVKPDVRVATQETLSIGEDRVVLASELQVNISRAGIFKLTFEFPEGMDVESLSGTALSHWTEIKNKDGRTLTLHLRGKTLGATTFDISLAGPGITTGEKSWTAPRLIIQEASKQVGQLQVVPEQGMRLNVQNRNGLTQLDPKKVGIQQKGVLVFRLLQSRWALKFGIEKVEPWIQAVVLQDVHVREGLHEVQANIDFEIENAGVKTLGFRLPKEAVGVRFRGAAVADAYRVQDGDGGDWEVKLARRFIGKLQVQLSYQTIIDVEDDAESGIEGIVMGNINLQRGFLTLKTGSRLELQLLELPSALKAVEWQSVPRNLKRGISDDDVHFTFRVLESNYRLPLRVIRHEVESVLPARVERVDIASVLSEAGILLTEVVLKIQPGNKPHLGLELPSKARFWSAFMNKKSVWPWREGRQILVPMEEGSVEGEAVAIKFLYTVEVGKMDKDKVENLLLGPSFDLPLENITWRVHLPEYWEVTDWEGSTLELREEKGKELVTFAISDYVQREASLRQEQYEKAESLLNISNDLLAKGEQRRARKALQSAWSLSQADRDFNEDARVQLQNLKTQQALVGLANRRNFYFNDKLGQQQGEGHQAKELLPYLGQKKANYTQQEAQQVLDQNSAEVNKDLQQLATCLIGHQDAALAIPEAIRANLPKQGQVLTFTRSLQVNTGTGLRIQIQAKRPADRAGFMNVGLALLGFLGLTVLSGVAGRKV